MNIYSFFHEILINFSDELIELIISENIQPEVLHVSIPMVEH